VKRGGDIDKLFLCERNSKDDTAKTKILGGVGGGVVECKSKR